MSDITVEFDTTAFLNSRGPALRRAQFAVDTQVIKDSNFFCPEADGFLKDSAITASRPGEGIVAYDTSYAAKQYYLLPNKSKDKNPNARGRWFEAARNMYSKYWLKAGQEAL